MRRKMSDHEAMRKLWWQADSALRELQEIRDKLRAVLVLVQEQVPNLHVPEAGLRKKTSWNYGSAHSAKKGGK